MHCGLNGPALVDALRGMIPEKMQSKKFEIAAEVLSSILIEHTRYPEFFSHDACRTLVTKDEKLYQLLRRYEASEISSPERTAMHIDIVGKGAVFSVWYHVDTHSHLSGISRLASADSLLNRMYDGQEDSIAAVDDYIQNWTGRLRELARGHLDLPTWVPDAEALGLSEAMASYLASLKIPCHPDNQPCLLLHNLGESDGENLDEKLNSIFGTTFHTSVIIPRWRKRVPDLLSCF